jgi:tRNA uridine 5-carboxymethylaminomethyl modification enzyme
MKSLSSYDIVVIGGGHAGVEAAAAAARIGCRVLLATHRLDRIARLSCNPAIGGLAKGHLVREIDALGGVMGLATDATGLHYRMLNTGKGPAVRAPRVQVDKVDYPIWVRRYLERIPGLDLAEAVGSEILVDAKGVVCGVAFESGESVECRAAIVTAGTFLDGLIHIGMRSHPGGRWDDPASTALAESLRRLGLETMRLKTGTPARLDSESIRWDALERQPGDEPPPRFSTMSTRINGNKIDCAITHTNPRTHEIIRANLDRSALYGGIITGVGPRYCPSIETKLERFAERDRHQIFLEPESLHNRSVYANGISTSLPNDVQDAFIRTIAGLEEVRVLRYGYAIEYVAFPPTQMRPTLETRAIEGLYLAGQVNGTTGYEEAAGLGLLAGANAALKICGSEPMTFRRDEAYLGVMVDDLIAKGAPEPYRLFTSRAEYRLLLRQDNADLRLTERGREVGLVDDSRWERFTHFRDRVAGERERLAATRVRPESLDAAFFERAGTTPVSETTTLERLLVRPEVDYATLCEWGFGPEWLDDESVEDRDRVVAQVEVGAKYAGYIERQNEQVRRHLGMETAPIPEAFDYACVPSLRREAAQILSERRPATIGIASRLPGVNPADITAVVIHMKVGEAKNGKEI